MLYRGSFKRVEMHPKLRKTIMFVSLLLVCKPQNLAIIARNCNILDQKVKHSNRNTIWGSPVTVSHHFWYFTLQKKEKFALNFLTFKIWYVYHNADFEKAKIKCIYYLYKSPMEFMWCSLMPLIISELPINIHHELQFFFEKNHFFVSFM